MYCMHCGKELPNTAKFCDRCGKTVGQEKPQEPIVHTAIPKKSGNMGCLSWILILVALYCIYTWFLKPMGQKKDAIENKAPTSSAAADETTSPDKLEAERLAARLPGVPEEYYDLPIFKNRLYGNCTTLEGDVAITVLFMDDQESYWTQESKDTFLSAVYNVCEDLSTEASEWGKEVNFTVYSTQGYVDEIVYPELAYLGFTNYVSSAGLTGNIAELAETLQAQTYSEKVPMIVAFNKWGRSFANAFDTETTQVERCYIFDDTSALKHELLHLFGATDFYYHDTVEQAVDQYLGYSIMASGDAFAPVDDMTAYLIGWTDTLTTNASSFMYAAGAVGTEAMNEASQQNAQNGYVVNATLSNGRIYTGVLAMGSPNGTGEMFWPNGNHYYGEWDHGQMTYGTFTWASGNVYVGQFQNGQMHGQGTVTFTSGQTQSGYWENGQFIG